MSDISVRHYILITCVATFFLSAPPALADWSGKTKQKRYNNQFGDFPPEDIDKHIQNSLDKYREPTEQKPAQSAEQTNTEQPVYRSPPGYQQPYRQYNQPGNYNRRPGNYRNNNMPGSYNSGFSGPWNNNGSNFSMPWGGNNNGSNFSMPWGGNNNDSNFSMPWGGNNNGSNFSMPWGNNNSGNNSYRNFENQ